MLLYLVAQASFVAVHPSQTSMRVISLQSCTTVKLLALHPTYMLVTSGGETGSSHLPHPLHGHLGSHVVVGGGNKIGASHAPGL